MKNKEPDNNLAKEFKRKGDFFKDHRRDFDEAIKFYEKALKLKPDYFEVWNSLGIVYDLVKDYDKSIKCYQKAIEIKADFPNSWNNLGITYKNKGHYNEAIKSYNKALSLKPDYYQVWSNFGVVYDILDMNDKSIKCYQKSIEIKADYFETWNNLGIVYNKITKHKEAIESYKRAIEIKPDNPAPLVNLGNIYDKIGEQNKAIECYERALRLNPILIEALYNLAVSYDINKSVDKAIELYEKVLEIKPDYDKAIFNLEKLFREKGNTDKADKYYEKGKRIIKSDLTIDDKMSSYDDISNYKLNLKRRNEYIELLEKNTITEGLKVEIKEKLNQIIKDIKSYEDKKIEDHFNEISTPICENISRERKSLLIFSVLALIIRFANLIPKSIEQFNITFDSSHQKLIIVGLGFIVFYFFLSFLFHFIRECKIIKVKESEFKRKIKDTNLEAGIDAIKSKLKFWEKTNKILLYYFPLILGFFSILILILLILGIWGKIGYSSIGIQNFQAMYKNFCYLIKFTLFKCF